MSVTTLNTKFKLRRDDEASWLSADPVLADGEPVLALVNGVYKMKIGDGESSFSELAYYGGSGGNADWETLLNKPFYEQQIATQNIAINYEDDPDVSGELSGVIMEIYKISDEYFVDELLNNFVIDYSVQVGASEPQLAEDVLISDLTLNHDPTATIVILPSVGNLPILVSVASNNTIINGIEIAEKGTYGLRVYREGEFEIKLINCSIPTYTEIKKIDKKFLHLDWDDIENKPFYEETVPAINLEIPTGASYVEASFTTTDAEPMTIPMKLYRAGGVYTTEQLVGATATIDIGTEDPDSRAIDSDAFLEIEQDGETVGYFVVGDYLYAFIVLADNTVFNTSLDLFGMTTALTSDNIQTAGTYLINTVFGEDETTCTSITKAANTIVHQLDSKYLPSGSGLPASFPQEDIKNAGMFIGFDSKGEYHATDPPSSAEKFVVTLTQDKQTKEWTAADGVTIADIVAADEANRVVVAKYPNDGIYVELPLNMAMEYQGMYAIMFIGFVNAGNDNKIVSVQGINQGSGDVITTTWQFIPTSSNAPLIVTLTISNNAMVGDKTYGEVLEAALAGRSIKMIFDGEIGGVATQSIVNPVSVYAAGGSVMIVYFSVGASGAQTISGLTTDDVTISLGS